MLIFLHIHAEGGLPMAPDSNDIHYFISACHMLQAMVVAVCLWGNITHGIVKTQ